MAEVSYTDDEVTIDGVTHRLRHPVESVLQHDGRVLVVLRVPTGTVDNANVIAFDADGTRRWEIEPSPAGPNSDNPYMGLSVEDGSVIADTWVSMTYVVDLDTGAVSPHEFRR